MFIVENETKNQSKADIRIVGVGGGGSNAVQTMIKEGIKGVKYIAVNTDHQALDRSSAETKIQLGVKLTKGLGAGANPEVGRRAAVESYEEIVQALKGADMVFVTAGMGGGTGTGGAPLVAQAADELGLLTVGIVTKPFVFEGPKRMRQAEKGIRELRNYVDTLIVAPNEKLLKISEQDTPLLETFKLTDEVLLKAVKGIAELVSVPGLINLDFADIKTVMTDKGMALMGQGISEGKDRAKKAIHTAISSPLLEGVSIQGATGMIVNITAGSNLSLREVQEASSVLTNMADEVADVIVGAVIDESLGEKLSVTVIATGFQRVEEKALSPESSLSNFPTEGESLERKSLFPDRKMEFEEESHREATVQEPPFPENQENQENQSPPPFTPERASPLPLAYSDKESSLEDHQSPPDKTEDEKKPSPKEILLSKVKEYENQKHKVTPSENQMSMNWKGTNQWEEKLSSPFEPSVDFSDEDMV